VEAPARWLSPADANVALAAPANKAGPLKLARRSALIRYGIPSIFTVWVNSVRWRRGLAADGGWASYRILAGGGAKRNSRKTKRKSHNPGGVAEKV